MNLTKNAKLLSLAVCGILTVFLLTNFTGKSVKKRSTTTHVQSQEMREIEGIVLDKQNNPLSRVTVAAEGGTKTKTGKDGKFRLSVSSKSTISVGIDGYKAISFPAMTNEKDPSFNPFFKIILATTDKDRTNQGYILFCCTNHDISHCSEDLDELEQLAESKGCEF